MSVLVESNSLFETRNWSVLTGDVLYQSAGKGGEEEIEAARFSTCLNHVVMNKFGDHSENPANTSSSFVDHAMSWTINMGVSMEKETMRERSFSCREVALKTFKEAMRLAPNTVQQPNGTQKATDTSVVALMAESCEEKHEEEKKEDTECTEQHHAGHINQQMFRKAKADVSDNTHSHPLLSALRLHMPHSYHACQTAHKSGLQLSTAHDMWSMQTSRKDDSKTNGLMLLTTPLQSPSNIRFNLTEDHVLQQIKKRDWAALEEMLDDPANDELLTDTFEGSETGTENALQVLCQYEPPAEIVKKIVELYPSAALNKNEDGRTALHIAAANGASYKVLHVLASVSPADAKDNEDKTPLIAACEVPGGPSDNVVRLLYHVSPNTVNDEDADGMTALEYAIISGTEHKAVRSLQQACQRQWRRVQEEKVNEMKEKNITSSPLRNGMVSCPRRNSQAAIAA